MASQQADVPWSQLRMELVLLATGILVPLVSYLIDARAGCHDWFARSGAVAVLISGYVGYRSLTKHYNKFFNDTERGGCGKNVPQSTLG
jgi:hypothetical protein